MIIASVSQSVSYFTVPPRAHPPPPVRRLSETPSGFAAPGQTQVPSVTRVLHSSHSHWNTAVIEDLPRCPTTSTRFPSHSVTHSRHANQVNPSRTRPAYMMRVQHAIRDGTSPHECGIVIRVFIPARDFPNIHILISWITVYAVSLTHNCTQ